MPTNMTRAMLAYDDFSRIENSSWGMVTPYGAHSWFPLEDDYIWIEDDWPTNSRAYGVIIVPASSFRKVLELHTPDWGYFTQQEVTYRFGYRDAVAARVGVALRTRVAETASQIGSIFCYVDPVDSTLKIVQYTTFGTVQVLASTPMFVMEPHDIPSGVANVYWLKARVIGDTVEAACWKLTAVEDAESPDVVTLSAQLTGHTNPSGYVGHMTQGGTITSYVETENFYVWDVTRDLDALRPGSFTESFDRWSLGSWSRANSGLFWEGHVADVPYKRDFAALYTWAGAHDDHTAFLHPDSTEEQYGLIGPLYARNVEATTLVKGGEYGQTSPGLYAMATLDSGRLLTNSRADAGYFVTFSEGSTIATLNVRHDGLNVTTLDTVDLGFAPALQDMALRIKVTATQVLAKVWDAATIEPVEWQLSSDNIDLQVGQVGIRTARVSGTGVATTRFEEFTFTEVVDDNAISTLSLIASDISDDAVTLAATASGDTNGSATTGRIFYREAGTVDWQAANEGNAYGDGIEVDHIITGLNPNSTYSVRFGVVDSDGFAGGIDGVFTRATSRLRYGRSRYAHPVSVASFLERYALGTIASSNRKSYPGQASIFAEGSSVFGHVPITGDDNDNRSGTYRWRELGGTYSAPAPMTQDCAQYGLARGLCVRLALGHNLTYEVELTITDPDGVTGETIFLGSASTTGLEVKPLSLDATATDQAVELVASYDYDANEEASVVMQYRDIRSTIWNTVSAEYVARVAQDKQFDTVVPGLLAATTYEARAQFSSPHGVLPTGNPDAPSSHARERRAGDSPAVGELSTVFTTRGENPSGPPRHKHFVYKVYDFDDTYVGTWKEVPEPQFSMHMNGGVSDLTVTLPRKLSEIDTDPTINFGNRVDVWAMDYQSDGMGPNLVLDDDFNDGSWTLAGGAAILDGIGPDSSRALRLTSMTTQSATLSPISYVTRQKNPDTGTWEERFQHVPLVATALCNPESGAVGGLELIARDADGGFLASKVVTTSGNGWQKLRLIYTPPVDTVYLTVELNGGHIETGGQVTFDKVSVRPQEILIYRGRIETFTPTVAQEEQSVTVEVLGLISTITDDYIRFKQFVTHQPPRDAALRLFNYGPQDVTVMLQEIIDEAQDTNARFELWYDDNSIKLTGQVVEYTFRDQQIRSAFDRARSLAPAEWYYYVEPDGKVIFQGKDHAQVHVLRLGVEVTNYENERTIRNLKNEVIVKGRQDSDRSESTFGSVQAVAFDQQSIDRYGRRVLFIRDAQIIDPETADIVAQGRLAENNVIEQQATLTVLDEKGLSFTGGALRGYNIESFAPGDYVLIIDPITHGERTYWDQFRWDESLWDDSGQKVLVDAVPIKTVNYRGDHVVLDLSERQPSATAEFASLLKWMQLKEQDQATLGEV